MRIYTTLTGMLLGLITVGVVNGNENNHPFNYNEGNIERRLQQKGFDIVFLVDESESMSPEQASLKSHVPTIFNAMNAHSPVPPSKAGLVGFGGMNISHPHDGHTHIPLTTDQTMFQNAVNSLTLDGIEEPSIEFICKTIQGGLNQDLGFRTNTTFGIVLISDEPSNFDNPEYTMQRTIDTLNNIPPYLNQANAKGIFYGIVPFGPAYDFYKNISIATGGEMYDSAVFRTDVYPGAEWVLTDIITKLNAAVNHLGTTYVILAPKSASCPTGIPVQLNAFVTVGIDPLAGIYVYFEVTSGPNKGEIGVSVTDATGKATWMFTNNGVAGNCTYEACIIYEGEEHCDSSGQPPPPPPPVDPLTSACINCNSPDPSTPFTTETIITATTVSSCGPLMVNVSGAACWRDVVGGLHKYECPTCMVENDGPSIVIGNQCQAGDHVEWSVNATNAVGQSATKMCYLSFTGARRLQQSNLRGTS